MRPWLAVAAILVAQACVQKASKTYSGRYLVEHSEDGQTWANTSGGLAGRGSRSRGEEEAYYGGKLRESARGVCERLPGDRAKVRVRGYALVKEGGEAIPDAELKAAPKFDTDCATYLAGSN